MPKRRRAGTALILVNAVTALLLMHPGAAMAVDVNGDAEDNTVTLSARRAQAAADAHSAALAAGEAAAQLVEYARGQQCNVNSLPLTSVLNGPCPPASGVVSVPTCPGGVVALLPLWTRTRVTPTNPWTPWGFLAGAACPQDVVPEFTLEDFRRLPLAPTTTTVQPGTATVLVNYGIIVTADPTPQTLTTALLGYPVTVHATPVTYTWDFGDGTDPLVTTDPGIPYPDDGTTPPTAPGSIYPVGAHGHPYSTPGTYTLTLTTTWTGTYQITGTTTWHPITGVATTTTTHPPLTVVERRTHLVDRNCLDNPHGPGC
jgi:hypothetical protein